MRAVYRTWRVARLSRTPVRTLVGLLAARVSHTEALRPHLFRCETVALLARSLDLHGIHEVFVGREYDCLRRFLHVRPSPMVLDLGANIGAFAAFVFAECPSARVHSVEPSPDTFALLERNRRLNIGLNWTSRQAAVWTSDGTTCFASGGASTGRRIRSDGSGVTVPAVTLQSLLQQSGGQPERVNLLKMDIEGAELDVLKSAEQLLGCVDVLVVEVHPPHEEHSIRRLLGRSFPVVEHSPRRSSAKPVLVAHRLVPAAPASGSPRHRVPVAGGGARA